MSEKMLGALEDNLKQQHYQAFLEYIKQEIYRSGNLCTNFMQDVMNVLDDAGWSFDRADKIMVISSRSRLSGMTNYAMSNTEYNYWRDEETKKDRLLQSARDKAKLKPVAKTLIQLDEVSMDNRYAKLMDTCALISQEHSDVVTPEICVDKFSRYRPEMRAKPSEMEFDDIIAEHERLLKDNIELRSARVPPEMRNEIINIFKRQTEAIVSHQKQYHDSVISMIATRRGPQESVHMLESMRNLELRRGKEITAEAGRTLMQLLFG
jgi:hypothetical protein